MFRTSRESFSGEDDETNLEELYADGGKHELKQERDEHDVIDGSYCDNHALYDVLHLQLEYLSRAHTSAKPSIDLNFAVIYCHQHSPDAYCTSSIRTACNEQVPPVNFDESK